MQQLNVIGDIAKSIHKLTEELKPNTKKWNINFLLKVKENVLSHLSKYEEDNRFPILRQWWFKINRNILPDDSIVTLDKGIY